MSLSRWNHWVLALLMVMLSTMMITVDATNLVTCTQEGIRRASSDTAESIRDFAALPQNLLTVAAQNLIARVTHPNVLATTPVSPYSPTPFYYLDRDTNQLNSWNLTTGVDGTRVDHLSTRITEQFFPNWVDTYAWNYSCTIANEDVAGATLDEPPVDGCVIPRSSNLTILCPLLYPACPSPSVARSSPQSYAQWSSNSSNGYCPPYCLDPLRFDNSLTKYLYDFAYPFAEQSTKIGEYIGTAAVGVYYNDIHGGFRYWPSLEPSTYASVTFPDWQWHQVAKTSPQLNPTRVPYWTAPYYDQVTTRSIISLLMPVYIADEWQGAICADLSLSETQHLFVDQKPTANSFIIAVDASGGLVSAEAAAYSYIFCPDAALEACNGTTTFNIQDYSAKLLSATIGLAESSLGFAQIPSLINNAALSNLQTLILRNATHFVSWSKADTSLPYTIVVITPTTDITQAAVWDMSISSHTLTSDAPSVSFTLTNTGLLPITWHTFGLPSGYTLTPSVNTTLAAMSSVTLTLSVSSMSVFDITSANIWLLQLVPSGEATYDSCFESLSMQVTVTPAILNKPEIEFGLNPALAVLAFVVTIIGAWISVTLVEQIQSRIRDRKNYLIWFIACPLAMTMCAIWPCVLIMMSAISLKGTTSHDDIGFDSVWMMTGWLLSLVCLYPSFYLISADLKIVSPLHALTRLDDAIPLSSPAGGSSSKRDQRRFCGVRLRTALFSWRTIAASVLFELAVISPQLMAVNGIIIPGHGVVTHSWRALLALLLTMLLYPIAIAMIVNVYASRWRLAIPLLLAAAIAIPIIVDIASLTLPWVPPATEMVASAGALWKTSHLTLSGCLLAAITFVFFMGGNIMNLKLSRDSLDVAMAETSRELAELKIAFASLTNDNIRLWQIIDTINGIRPAPRASATLAFIAGNITNLNNPANGSNGSTYHSGGGTGGTFISVASASPASHHHVRSSTPDQYRDTSSPIPMATPTVITPSTILTPGLKSSLSSGAMAPAGGAAAKSMAPARASAYAAPPPSTAVSAAVSAAAVNHNSNAVVPLNESAETSQIATGTNSINGNHSTNNNMVASLVPPIGTSLKQLTSHPVTLELLKDALQSERSIENMMFWLDAGRFELITSPDERRKQALAIYITFIGSDAPHQVNLSAAMAAHISRAVTAGVAPRDLFVSARNEIGNLITTNVLPRFIRSDAHELAVQLLSGLPLPSRISNNNGAPNTPTVTTVAAATAGGHPQSPSSQ